LTWTVVGKPARVTLSIVPTALSWLGPPLAAVETESAATNASTVTPIRTTVTPLLTGDTNTFVTRGSQRTRVR
jgi:hypothetical protein